MFESKGGILWIGGLGFFAFAFLSNALLPMMMYKELPEQSAEEVVNDSVLYQFEDLSRRYPAAFRQHYDARFEGKKVDQWTPAEWKQACADTLRLGRQLYVGEGCWHCHSQFVRPVSNESQRWGAVAESREYQNELQRPVLFGTRRVGPDLSREGGRRGNDWHVVHFHRPKSVSPGSPMPAYPWLFASDEQGAIQPNDRGFAVITYVQWLGSWLKSYPYYEELDDPAEESKP